MNLDDGVISEINQTQGKNCNILYMKAKKVKFIEGESRMVVTRSKEVREMSGWWSRDPKWELCRMSYQACQHGV